MGAACAGATRGTPAPPLGASLSEQIPDAGAQLEAEAAAPPKAFAIERVDRCETPRVPELDASAPREEHDVAFGADSHQRYDLAFPAEAPKKLLVVMIHGGGWTSGKKSLFLRSIRTFANLGYLAASLEYRLAADHARAFPAGLADVRCGLRAVQARAHELGVDKTVVIGASSGGHLAAMVAVAGNASGFDGNCDARGPVHVDGAVLYYAPLELDRAKDRYPPKMVQAVDELLRGAATVARDGGAESSALSARAKEATPSHYIDSTDPPILLLHGQADNIVPIQDARDFKDALDRAHVPALLVELPEQKHGFPVLGRNPPLQPSTCSMLRFLQNVEAAPAR